MTNGLRSMSVLPARDVMESADFLTRGFGFETAGYWKDDDGTPSFAICRLDQVTVGLRLQSDIQPDPGWSAYIYVDDVGGLVDLARAAGIEVSGPEDRFYACREIECTDPSGNKICFATDLNPGNDGPGL